jgi:hypothetical protein
LRFCQAQSPHVPSEHTPTTPGFAHFCNPAR